MNSSKNKKKELKTVSGFSNDQRWIKGSHTLTKQS
jgi:hypothetical protein